MDQWLLDSIYPFKLSSVLETALAATTLCAVKRPREMEREVYRLFAPQLHDVYTSDWFRSLNCLNLIQKDLIQNVSNPTELMVDQKMTM